MSILSSLFDWVFAILKSIVSFIVDFIKEYWLLLVIIALIWFAPAIGAYLATSGAPGFLVSAFTWVGTTITPVLVGGLASIWTWGAGVASASWTAFAGASIGVQAAVVVGAGMLIAPEETAELISEVGEVAAEIVYATVSAVASGTGLSTGLLVAGLGLTAWFFFFRSDDETVYLEEKPQ